MMWLALAGAIGMEVLATLSLRASDGFRRRKWIVPVAAGYLVSFYLLWLSLSLGMPVGVAYGIWTACGVALVAVAARLLFRDPLTWRMLAGIGLIIAGVLTIEMGGLFPLDALGPAEHTGQAREQRDQQSRGRHQQQPRPQPRGIRDQTHDRRGRHESDPHQPGHPRSARCRGAGPVADRPRAHGGRLPGWPPPGPPRRNPRWSPARSGRPAPHPYRRR